MKQRQFSRNWCVVTCNNTNTDCKKSVSEKNLLPWLPKSKAGPYEFA